MNTLIQRLTFHYYVSTVISASGVSEYVINRDQYRFVVRVDGAHHIYLL